MIDREPSAVFDGDAARIDVICDVFERAFKGGAAPRIEDFVLMVREELRTEALRELLRIEIELRRSQQEDVGAPDYLTRFPEHKELLLEFFQTGELVLATVAQDPPPPRVEKKPPTLQRRTFESSSSLEVRCPSCHAPTAVAVDTKLTDIKCSSCGDHFSLVNRSESTEMATSLSRLGRFDLVERLGVGGFGSVWKARDKELDRTVALKIPRAGDMSPEEQDKFFREARTAAQLRHPNIVSVHEVGRDGDSVYIVSDFIRGVTLRDWLSGQQLTSREAAELCAKIADALQHAHEQGVVHRDLKPGNIMMDGNGEPHLMDFGLARREVGEVTVTVAGQILGTPAYMSPEQAQGDAHKADRRSDVYSLGVVLFQLLTGELPFRGNSRMIMHQVIHDEPRNPRSLNDRVARDLETICMKCLQKDPNKRYQRADELAADLRRYLARQPIQARPVGHVERFWRWCRRNPMVASLTATAGTLLILVAAATSIGNYNTRRALEQADANYEIALIAVDEMLTVVGDDLLANVPQMEAARGKLLRKALVAYQGLLNRKPTDNRARLQLADAYYRVANIQRELGEQNEAADAYKHAIKLFKGLSTEFPNEPEHRNYIGMAYDYLGETERDAQHVEEAEKAYQSALAIQQDLLKESSDNEKYHQELSRTQNNFGILLMETDRLGEAEQSLRDAIRILTQLSRKNADEVTYQQELARSYINLGNLLTRKVQADEAEEAYRSAVKLLDTVVEQHPDIHHYRCNLAVSLVNLSNFLRETSKKPDEAAPPLNRSIDLLTKLAEDYPRIPRYRKELANAHNSLANLYAETGKLPEAEKSLEKARSLFEQLLKEHPDNAEYQSLTGMTLGGLAWVASEKKDQPKAVGLVEQAIEHQQTATDLNRSNPDFQKRLAGHRNFLKDVKAKLSGTTDAKH